MVSDIRQSVPQMKPTEKGPKKNYPKMMTYEKDGKILPHMSGGRAVIVQNEKEEEEFKNNKPAGKAEEMTVDAGKPANTTAAAPPPAPATESQQPVLPTGGDKPTKKKLPD